MSLKNGKMQNQAGYSETPPNQQRQKSGELLQPQKGEQKRPGNLFTQTWNRFKSMF